MKPIILIGFLIISNSLAAQLLKSGDLLFVSSMASDFEKAIVSVTDDKLQQNFSHVGMVNVTDSGIFVIEAVPQGVIYIPVSEFKQNNIGKSLFIGRFKTQYQPWIPKAIAYAYSLWGKPYDFAFDFNNEQYYCSELVYLAFAQSSGKADVFETPPMTFKTSENTVLPYWIDYFAKLGIPVPEGKQGLNPNGMSCSDKLESLIIYKP